MVNLGNATECSVIRTALQTTLLIAAAFLFPGGTALATPPDTMHIWRAQVRFITADGDDAGTDDSVRVELNGANRTWLNSARDDRERGSDETFDLRLEGVDTLADIDYFRIQKMGDDGWAIRRMYLIINEKVIYEGDFPSALWLDTENGHAPVYFLDDFFMRPQSQWISYVAPVRPNVVPLNDMRLRIEGVVGDFTTLHYLSHPLVQGLLMAKFGPYSVEPYTLNTDTWRVDLDMEADGDIFNLNIDVDFDLRVTCSSGRADFNVANVNASASLGWYAVDDARSFVKEDFESRLDQMMKNFTFFPWCPTIVLAPNGDLHFDPKFPPIHEDPVVAVDDTRSPLGVHVVTGDIRAFEETKFAVTVKSRLEKDAELDVSFELPAQIAATDAIVEANGAKERRTIDARLTSNADGTSSMAFRDLVIAGMDAEYTLHLRFQPRENATGKLVTNIKPATRELAASITALRAVTYFAFESGAVLPEGTTIQNSAYVESGREMPVESR